MGKFDHEFNKNIEVRVDQDVDVDIDLKELMDNLSDEALESYCKERGIGEGLYNVKTMVDAYYHNDLDLENLLRKLGKKTVAKILEAI